MYSFASNKINESIFISIIILSYDFRSVKKFQLMDWIIIRARFSSFKIILKLIISILVSLEQFYNLKAINNIIGSNMVV